MGLMRVMKNESLASGVYGLEISASPELLSASPGSFIHIAVDGVFLRRPFGIHAADAKKGTITIAYAVRGKGTQVLTRVCPGAEIDVLGPLGKGFRLPQGAEHILLIGGGMGAAPLLHAAQSLNRKASCDIALGFASAENAFSIDRFKAYCQTLRVATEDGSLGEKGSV
ncbi:MAG: dihydroorotate dehydrogenase electron transfer subunit, partial [Bacillota bacterium]